METKTVSNYNDIKKKIETCQHLYYIYRLAECEYDQLVEDEPELYAEHGGENNLTAIEKLIDWAVGETMRLECEILDMLTVTAPDAAGEEMYRAWHIINNAILDSMFTGVLDDKEELSEWFEAEAEKKKDEQERLIREAGFDGEKFEEPCDLI